MGDFNIDQGDVVEIDAEPNEIPPASLLERTGEIIISNGWYILGGALAAYYVWKNYGVPIFFNNGAAAAKPAMTDKELRDFQTKEEQRLKALQKLQEKYDKEASERAAQIQAREEEKKKAKLAELERLNPGIGSTGQKLGNGTDLSSKPGPSTSKSKPKSASFRPEYNPLMGDTTSRVCFRPAGGGRSGG